MVRSKQFQFGSWSLLVLFFASCGKDSGVEERVIDPDDQSKPNQTAVDSQGSKKSEPQETKEKGNSAVSDTAIVVRVRNNNEAELQGETISKLDKLASQVSRKLFSGNRKEDLSVEIAIDADEKATFQNLSQALKSFQLYGFRNLRFRCGEANVKIPMAVANSLKKPSLYVLTINASQTGEFQGLKIERDSKDSWLESGDVENALEYAEKRLKEFVEQVSSKSDGTTQEIDIEIKSPANISAQTYLKMCGKLHALAQTHGKSSPLSIRLWPLGLPREQAIEIHELNEPLQTEFEQESKVDKLEQQKELKEFEFDSKIHR